MQTDLPHCNDNFKAFSPPPTDVEQVVVYGGNGSRQTYAYRPDDPHTGESWLQIWINSGWRVVEHRGRSLFLELAGV